MGGIAAVFDLECADRAAEGCQRMTLAMSYRGVDGTAVFSSSPEGVALGHCTMFTDEHQRSCPQPWTSINGTLAITLDGYLANILELSRDLAERGHRLRSHGDAEIVLAAYAEWGEECCARFDGEYAFVIWDQSAKRLFAARDHQGMRPLHYHWSGKRLLIASDIAGILANLGKAPTIDRSFLSEIIANEYLSREDTIWSEVKRLTPATALSLTGRQLRQQTHWSVPLGTSIRHRTLNDYADHYIEVLTRCVERASRTDRPLACEVSGGLDSTSIFAIADKLAGDGHLQAPALRGYSFLAEPGSRADEIAYARCLASKLGRTIEEVPMFVPPTNWFKEQSRADLDFPTYCNTAILVELGKRLVTDGSRVALNGQGGDIWLFGSPLAYHEMLRDGQWSRMARMLHRNAKRHGLFTTARQLLHFGLRPFAPGLYDLARRKRNLASTGEYPWIAEPWRTALLERITASRMNHPQRPYDYYKQLKLEMAFLPRFFEIFSRQSARIGFEPRSPMLSKEFIGFCAATPEYTRQDGSFGKALHRHAMQGILPEEVRLRTDFAEFSQVYEGHSDWFLENQGFHDNNVVNDLVERVPALALAKHFCSAAIDDRNGWHLWGVTGLKILASQFSGPTTKGE